MIELLGAFLIICILFMKSRNGLILWGLFFPIFDHIDILNIGDLFPAITFNRAVILIILLKVISTSYVTIKEYNYSNIVKAMIIFTFVILVQIFFSYGIKDTFRNYLSFFDSFIAPFIMFFLSIIIIKDYKVFTKFTKMIIIGSCFSAIMGVYEYITSQDVLPYVPETWFDSSVLGLRSEGNFVRANGPFMTPEMLGNVLSIVWFALYYHLRTLTFLNSNRKSIIAIEAGLFLLLCGVFSCMFRSIMLGLLIGLFVHIIINVDKFKRLTKLSFYAVTCFLLITFFNQSKLDMFFEDRILQKESMYSRIGAYIIVARAFKENPYMGIGYNNFSEYSKKINAKNRVTYKDVWAANSPHNQFLGILAENGIIGLTAYLFLIGSIAIFLIENLAQNTSGSEKEWHSAMIAIFISYLIPFFVETTGYYQSINMVFFVFLGCTVNAPSIFAKSGKL